MEDHFIAMQQVSLVLFLFWVLCKTDVSKLHLGDLNILTSSLRCAPDPAFFRIALFHDGFGCNQANIKIQWLLLYPLLSAFQKVSYSECFLDFWVENLLYDVLLAFSGRQIWTAKLRNIEIYWKSPKSISTRTRGPWGISLTWAKIAIKIKSALWSTKQTSIYFLSTKKPNTCLPFSPRFLIWLSWTLPKIWPWPTFWIFKVKFKMIVWLSWMYTG